MQLRRLIAVLGLVASAAFAPVPGAAGEISAFSPTGLLTPGAAQGLPFAPVAVTAFDDVVFAAGAANGKGEILRLDASTLQVSASLALDITPNAMVANFDNTLLFLIGRLDDGRTRIEVRDTDLTSVGEVTFEQPMQHPAMTMTQNDVLVVGTLAGATGPGKLMAFDMSRPGAPRPLPDWLPDVFGRTGVARAWFDETAGGTLFVNTAQPQSLVAVATKGEASGTRLSGLNFDGSAPVPMIANISSRPCLTADAIAWFLITSNRRLLLAAFDPASSFKSLDIVSLTETSLKIESKHETRYYDGTKLQQSTHLLASSCGMGVIWIGDRNSREVEQFAVNAKTYPPTLEKIGRLRLKEMPEHLIITASGQHGYTVSARTNTLTRFDVGGGKVTGTEPARILQRVLTEKGFPVGVIDGRIGDRTLSAITRFERSNGVTLDIRRDFNGAIETLQAAPPR